VKKLFQKKGMRECKIHGKTDLNMMQAVPARFVIKTSDDTGRKVFINMCGSTRVAAPGSWERGTVPETVQTALENLDNLSEEQEATLR
jgi:PIH1 N-terminal domain